MPRHSIARIMGSQRCLARPTRESAGLKQKGWDKLGETIAREIPNDETGNYDDNICVVRPFYDAHNGLKIDENDNDEVDGASEPSIT